MSLWNKAKKAWNDATPWDTKNEKKKKRKKNEDRLDDAEDAYYDAIDDFDTAVDDYQTAVEANKTRTVTDENGRQVVQQYNPDSGEWETTKTFDGLYDKLDELAGLEYHTNADAWAEATGNAGALQNTRSGLASTLSDLEGGLTDQDIGASRDYAAEMMGFGSWAGSGGLQEAIGGLADEVLAGVEHQSGLTDEERMAYERASDRAIDQYESGLERDLDAVAAGGSTMRYLAAADEVRRQVSDQRLAAEMQILETDYERRRINLEDKKQTWGMMVQQGTMTAQQFQEGIRADRVNAFKAYSERMQTLLQERQTDIQATMAHADNIYKQINAEIGIDTHAMETAAEMYKQQMQPYLDTMQAEAMALQAESQRFAVAEANWQRREAEIANSAGFGDVVQFGLGIAATAAGAALIATGAGAAPGAALMAGGTSMAGSGAQGLWG